MKEFDIGDIVETKKAHACLECGRIIMLPRTKFVNSIKKVVGKIDE